METAGSAAEDDLAFTDAGGLAMNEGLRFLAQQLAWERTLEDLRQRADADRRRRQPTTLPDAGTANLAIDAHTAQEIVGGGSFEAA
jgi:hypothetical protein